MMTRKVQVQIWTAVLAVLGTCGAVLAGGVTPVTGVDVDELHDFDDAVLDIVEGDDLVGCTVGVIHDGCVVYQRGFGYRDDGFTHMPENATMRLASVSKVLVKRAVHLLESDGLDLSWSVFDVGQADGGILDLEPFFVNEDDELDDRIKDITVQHLLAHTAGWAADYSWSDIDVYEAMGLEDPPPSIVDITRYAIGQPLADDPGDTYSYSNFGYNVLMLVIEEFSGQSYYSYVRQHVLTKDMWVPSTDLFPGEPFSPTGLREPVYFPRPGSWETDVPNVYDSDWPSVPWPYGGFNVEAMLGSSSMVTSAAPMLTFADLYPERWIGSMSGSSTRILTSSTDSNVHIVVLCNDRLDDESQDNWAGDQIALAIDAVIADGVTWPTTCIDGQWVKWVAPIPLTGNGSYDFPYGSMTWALSNVTGGTKLVLYPGALPYTGLLDKKLLLDAPLGAAQIGTNGL